MRVRTAAELVGLVVESLHLLRRFAPQLVFWFCCGWALHELGMLGSVLLGAEHAGWATIVFIAGVIAYAISLVLMLHSLEPGLRAPVAARDAELSAGSLRVPIPQPVFTRETPLTVVALALGPFLAIYTLWGLADEQVARLFEANILVHGNAGVTEWSVNLGVNLRLYLLLAAAAWVVEQVAAQVARRRHSRAAGLVATLADGVFVFASFVALLRLTGLVVDWITSRTAWVALADTWNLVLARLPDLRLPFDLTLPEAIRRLGAWVWQVLLPGAAENVLLPLMWLALAATVFGWRQFTARDLVADLPLDQVRTRLRLNADGRVVRALGWALTDLRVKYVPIAQALRLIWQAGPRFVGAYLVLTATLRVAEAGVRRVVELLLGPGPAVELITVLPLIDLLVGAVFTCWTVTVYAAGFDRSVAAVTGSRTRLRSSPRSAGEPGLAAR